MNRQEITNFKREDKYILASQNADVIFDLSSLSDKGVIEINKSSNIDLLLVNPKEEIYLDIDI